MNSRRSPAPLLALLLVAACNPLGRQQRDDQSNAAASAPAADMRANDSATPPDDRARFEAQARGALATLIANAESVPLRNLRPGVGGAVCGDVSAGGEFRGFVIPPEGQPVIGRSPGLDLNDVDDPYPPLYIRWCASGAELMSLTPQLSTPSIETEAVSNEIAALPEEGARAVLEAEPQPAAPPARRTAPATGDARRFSDAVLRPDER